MMQKTITLSYNGKQFECIAKVPFSNCICLEFKNTIKEVSETGYKCEYLGTTLTPLELMQTVEIDCLEWLKKACSIDAEIVSIDNLTYTPKDVELQRKWRDILSGKADGWILPQVQQLTLF